MKVGTIIRIILASFVIIAIAFTILTISNANEQTAVSTQASFKQLGLDLSGASDFLTNQARAYVQYGEKKYYDAYMNEVEVTKTRENVVNELKRLGAPQNELDLVQKAANLSNTLAELESRAFEAVEAGDLNTARQLMFGNEYENGKDPIVKTMQEFQDAMANRTNQAAQSAQSQARIFLIAFSILFVAVACVIIISLISIRKKMNLVAELADCASKMASGNADIIINNSSNDEIGVLANAFNRMVETIKKQINIAEHLADGDLTVEVQPNSNEDSLGIALKKMVDNLNKMFAEINNTTMQVAAATKQIAGGSQTLAQGSTEQASAVEQLSCSISEVALKTKDSADLASQASSLSNTIKDKAERGNRQMGEMVQSVREIGESSRSIGKIIKLIDDIAFQTNILSLNAAVEAARAGQHGKGFAIVAEEVRNLAAKSAQAAKDTGLLITNSIEKTEVGVNIANETAESLAEIVSGINENSRIVGKIANSSEEQAASIYQINKGIDQVTQVVQQNSATAQESAAVSEEMNGQAEFLQGLVSRFRLKNN